MWPKEQCEFETPDLQDASGIALCRFVVDLFPCVHLKTFLNFCLGSAVITSVQSWCMLCKQAGLWLWTTKIS